MCYLVSAGADKGAGDSAGAEKGAGDSASNDKTEKAQETLPNNGDERASEHKRNSYYDSLNIWVLQSKSACVIVKYCGFKCFVVTPQGGGSQIHVRSNAWGNTCTSSCVFSCAKH